MANRTIEAILRLSAKLGNVRAFRDLSSHLDRVDQKARAYNRTQGMLARSMNASYMAMARYVGPATFAYGAYKIGQAASSMEDALFSIQKKTGATEDQLASLRDQIKNVARDVPVSMEEIAAAFERGGAAGIPLDELEQFARLSVKVADAWDMSAEEVSNAFAGFEAGMGVPRKELEEFADLINHLADSGIADERDVVSFIDRVGASLKNFGLAREEIAGYGAAMLNLKIPAEVAARAMDTLTGKLIAPSNLSPKARGALGEIVGDLDRFAKLIEKDASGALDQFFDKLARFSNADRARLLGGLLGEGFDDEIMRLSAGLGELQRNLESIKDTDKYIGSIDAAAERKVALWSSQVQLIKNNLEAIADSVGAPVLDVLNKGLTGFNEDVSRAAAIDATLEKMGVGNNAIERQLHLLKEAYKRGWDAKKVKEYEDGLAWRDGHRTSKDQDNIEQYGRLADTRLAAPSEPPVPTLPKDADGMPLAGPIPPRRDGKPVEVDKAVADAGPPKGEAPPPIPAARPTQAEIDQAAFDKAFDAYQVRNITAREAEDMSMAEHDLERLQKADQARFNPAKALDVLAAVERRLETHDDRHPPIEDTATEPPMLADSYDRGDAARPIDTDRRDVPEITVADTPDRERPAVAPDLGDGPKELVRAARTLGDAARPIDTHRRDAPEITVADTPDRERPAVAPDLGDGPKELVRAARILGDAARPIDLSHLPDQPAMPMAFAPSPPPVHREAASPIGTSHRDAERESVAALKSDPNGIADAIDEALTRGGATAGSSIEEAARRINEEAQAGGSAFARMLEGVGRKLGEDAAASFKANIGTVTVKANVSVPRGVNADVGRSGADVAARGE